MNLNATPSPQQLQQLLSVCNDAQGSHVVWVSNSGEVRISRVGERDDADEFEKAHPEMKLRLATFLAGNEYVGVEAAADEAWVNELLERLVEAWQRAKSAPSVEFVDAV